MHLRLKVSCKDVHILGYQNGASNLLDVDRWRLTIDHPVKCVDGNDLASMTGNF